MLVAVYLLVRLEPLIRELKDSVEVLTMTVAKQNGVCAPNVRELKKALSVLASDCSAVK